MNRKVNILILILMIFAGTVSSQYYEISLKRDAAPLAVGVGLSGLSLWLSNTADRATIEEINLLDANDINEFDRGTIDNDSRTAQVASDIILFSSVSLPFLTYFSKKCRADADAIALMALETIMINNGITNITKDVFNRYRPFNYNPNVDLEMKLGSSSKKSFISGHTSNTTSFAFLAARVVTDLHPDMDHKALIWTTAATVPAVIGFLRVRAGRHFPTDVIGGYIVGAAVGYFIPSLHLVKNKNFTIQTAGIAHTKLSIKF